MEVANNDFKRVILSILKGIINIMRSEICPKKYQMKLLKLKNYNNQNERFIKWAKKKKRLNIAEEKISKLEVRIVFTK